MTASTPLVTDLIAKVQSYDPTVDSAWLESVYELANAAHQGQLRASGESYIEHPLSVARILADMEMDKETIAAAILHDVVEDTVVTGEQVSAKFGPEIAQLVEGVTKLTRIPYQSKEDAQVENLRKMFMAMAKDIRVIIIKLADRLHNMRTLASLPPEKQQSIARETIEIYAPIAHRLGIWKIKWDLEDLCLRYLDAEAYRDIAERVAMKRGEREAAVTNSVEMRVRDHLRSDRGSHHRRYGQGLLRFARRRAFALEADPGPLQRLHCDAQAQHVSIVAHDGRGSDGRSARDSDPHARNAPHERVRDRGALAL
jgi:(p)ppGpp synthase/HD superfamily hydrolase